MSLTAKSSQVREIFLAEGTIEFTVPAADYEVIVEEPHGLNLLPFVDYMFSVDNGETFVGVNRDNYNQDGLTSDQTLLTIKCFTDSENIIVVVNNFTESPMSRDVNVIIKFRLSATEAIE